jgi:predicted deacylase
LAVGQARFRHRIAAISMRGMRRRTTRRTISVADDVWSSTRAVLAGSDLFGRLHDRAERRGRRAFTLERGQQLRQRIDGMPHHGLHAFVRLDGVVEHAVEHVLHFPRELAEHAGTDQTAGTLQRVERTTDA